MKRQVFIVLFFVSCINFAGGFRDEGFNTKSGYSGLFNINNISVPFDYKGVIADVDPGNGNGAGGFFDSHVFLFSSGFFLSGYSDNTLWGNGVLTASRIEDYQAGKVGTDPVDSLNQIYYLSKDDIPFGESWQKWNDAVSLGADFYDGNNDGIYYPIDLNNNGVWDNTEDAPSLIGDWTAWCVYNDGVPQALRRFTSVAPKGIEVQQTIFGFKDETNFQNSMFVKYRIINKGTVNSILKDVLFSIAADADLGDANDDLVGCIPELNTGYFYNDGTDTQFGSTPPAFFINLLQGALNFIPGETFTDVNNNGVFDIGTDIAIDTAYNYNGNSLEVEITPGAKNIGMTSFTQYMQSHPTHGDPDNQYELRNYMIGGKGKLGNDVYVSTWTYGNGATLGSDTNTIKAKYMYSGNPVERTGWRNTTALDQRFMVNVGPFDLTIDNPIDMIFAYNVGCGTDALDAITKGKEAVLATRDYFGNLFPITDPVTHVVENSPIAETYKLEQNYPNPFNPNTTIIFSITNQEKVSLKIYDILGNEIATLVNSDLSTGSYSANWHATGVSSGVYFYKLQAGDFISTKKMLLLK